MLLAPKFVNDPTELVPFFNDWRRQDDRRFSKPADFVLLETWLDEPQAKSEPKIVYEYRRKIMPYGEFCKLTGALRIVPPSEAEFYSWALPRQFNIWQGSNIRGTNEGFSASFDYWLRTTPGVLKKLKTHDLYKETILKINEKGGYSVPVMESLPFRRLFNFHADASRNRIKNMFPFSGSEPLAEDKEEDGFLSGEREGDDPDDRKEEELAEAAKEARAETAARNKEEKLKLEHAAWVADYFAHLRIEQVRELAEAAKAARAEKIARLEKEKLERQHAAWVADYFANLRIEQVRELAKAAKTAKAEITTHNKNREDEELFALLSVNPQTQVLIETANNLNKFLIETTSPPGKIGRPPKKHSEADKKKRTEQRILKGRPKEKSSYSIGGRKIYMCPTFAIKPGINRPIGLEFNKTALGVQAFADWVKDVDVGQKKANVNYLFRWYKETKDIDRLVETYSDIQLIGISLRKTGDYGYVVVPKEEDFDAAKRAKVASPLIASHTIKAAAEQYAPLETISGRPTKDSPSPQQIAAHQEKLRKMSMKNAGHPITRDIPISATFFLQSLEIASGNFVHTNHAGTTEMGALVNAFFVRVNSSDAYSQNNMSLNVLTFVEETDGLAEILPSYKSFKHFCTRVNERLNNDQKFYPPSSYLFLKALHKKRSTTTLDAGTPEKKIRTLAL